MGVVAQKLLIRQSLLEEIAVYGEGHNDVGAGVECEMNVCLPGQVRAPRVNHDQRCSCLLGRLDVGHEMEPRTRRVCSPDDDEAGMSVVAVCHPRHFAVEGLMGGTCGHRTDRACESGRAELPEQSGVGRVLGQQAI